jgi:hypothetical protein
MIHAPQHALDVSPNWYATLTAVYPPMSGVQPVLLDVVDELGDFWCQPVEMSQLERSRERNLDREQEYELVARNQSSLVVFL